MLHLARRISTYLSGQRMVLCDLGVGLLLLGSSKDEMSRDVSVVSRFASIFRSPAIGYYVFGVRSCACPWVSPPLSYLRPCPHHCAVADVTSLLPEEMKERSFVVLADGPHTVVRSATLARQLGMNTINPVFVPVGEWYERKSAKQRTAIIANSTAGKVATELLNSGVDPAEIVSAFRELGYDEKELLNTLEHIRQVRHNSGQFEAEIVDATESVSSGFVRDSQGCAFDVYAISLPPLVEVDNLPGNILQESGGFRYMGLVDTLGDYRLPNEALEQRGYYRARHQY